MALDEAVAWADKAVKLNENFTTLNARALVAEKKSDATMARQLRDKALTVATEADMNNYGYTLLQSGKIDEALGVFPPERRQVSTIVEHVRQSGRGPGDRGQQD